MWTRKKEQPSGCFRGRRKPRGYVWAESKESLEVVLGHVGVLTGCGERSRFHLESSCAHRRVQAHTPHPQAWCSAALLAATTGDGRISGISKESAGDRRRSCDEGREDEDGREGRGLAGKGAAWDSVNALGRWERLSGQPGDFLQLSDGVLPGPG